MPAAASSNFVFRIGYSSRQRPLPFWAGLRRHRAFARNIGTAHASASSANDVLAPQAGTKFQIPLAKSVRSVASPALGIRGGNHDQDKVDFHRGCVCGRDVSGRGREETERCTEDSRDAASRRKFISRGRGRQSLQGRSRRQGPARRTSQGIPQSLHAGGNRQANTHQVGRRCREAGNRRATLMLASAFFRCARL